MPKKVIVIGSGFAGLAAASFMAAAGWETTVLEKLSTPGGRARKFEAGGFTFDMGPSWYWMPDIFERYFSQFGKTVNDFYALRRLDPSYRIYWEEGNAEIPASLEDLKIFFEKLEPGSALKLDRFLAEAGYKYRTGMQKLVFKPGLSVTEFIDSDVLRGVFKLDIFTSIKKHISKYFSHPKIRQMLEFPVLFLGALPEDTPALYSLMNYADIIGGTWYPDKGMYTVVQSMYDLACSLGVKFVFNEEVRSIDVEGDKAVKVHTAKNSYGFDALIGGADYHFIETQLLPEKSRSYSDDYWEKRLMAPSCLIYYIGIDKRIPGLSHHSLFFDTPFDAHGKEIYKTKQWPEDPLFYVSAPSVSDASVAPDGCENLFFLIPVAAGLSDDTEALREKYFNKILRRFEARTGTQIETNIIVKKSFAYSDFVHEYNSFKGNAYGLANTLTQTAILKPSCRSKKVRNLFYTGQLTVPGPGVPPSLISGEVVAKEVIKNFA